ncbi:leukocyte receptor cluster member 9 [Pogona vitticeps]
MAELLPSPEKDLTRLGCATLVEPLADPTSLPTEQVSAEINPPCRFFLEGRCRFGVRCRNYHSSDGDAHHFEDRNPTSKRSSQLSPSKKPAMKTAEDVISRLLWDAQVPAEHFSVGYLDRFLGIVEQPFNAFSWEDLTSAGPAVLAIPKHRIQYFKYRDRTVWDKGNRTDDIFGSTGSGRTILDVMKEEEEAAQAIKEENDSRPKADELASIGQVMAEYSGSEDGNDPVRAGEKQLNRTTAEVGVVNKIEESMQNLKLVGDACSILSENGASNRMEQEEVLSVANSFSTKEKVIEHSSEEDGPGMMEGSIALESREMYFPRPRCRPTHFVAIPVTSPEIWKAVKLFQEALCRVRPDLAKFCVPLASLHLTLGLMRLHTPEEIYKAVVALQELQANTRRLLPPALLLSFCSVETFHSHVLYMSPASVPDLDLLAQTLENAFSKKGLTVIQPPHTGKFHLTIVKIPPAKAAPQLPTDSSWIPSIENLGTQAVEALCLCEAGKHRTDGAYTTVLKLKLY